MNTAKNNEKKYLLNRYKALATALFLLMALVFIVTSYLISAHNITWLGYFRAFSEAAMVGALADWFAVTALFHYPLGLKIPHTNLIQNKKDQIGGNLGEFVVSNFLATENIRPYIAQLQISKYLSSWLSVENNQKILLSELSAHVVGILNEIDEEKAKEMIATQGKEMLELVDFREMLGSGLEYILEQELHQTGITQLSGKIRQFILENHELIRARVQKQSSALIPRFIDNSIAEKITLGLADYFQEVESDPTHPLRGEIQNQLHRYALNMRTEESLVQHIDSIKQGILSEERLESYSGAVYSKLKYTLIDELTRSNSTLQKYLREKTAGIALSLQSDEELQNKIDRWVRHTLYRTFLRKKHLASALISRTVEGWEGRELSEKLELEVGKDLQFIRINGTLVGGLVGLIIYTLTQVFS